MFLLLFFILIAGNLIHAEDKPYDYYTTRDVFPPISKENQRYVPTPPRDKYYTGFPTPRQNVYTTRDTYVFPRISKGNQRYVPTPTTPPPPREKYYTGFPTPRQNVYTTRDTFDLQPYSDATLNKLASTSPLFATILSLIKQVERLKKITRQQFMLPPNVFKLVGTIIQKFRSHGPLSSATPTGYWTWRTNPRFNQTVTNTNWTKLLKGVNVQVESGPMILPMTPHFIAIFVFIGKTENEMELNIAFFNITYNHDLSSHLPFKFDMEIRIQNQGFSETQKCSFNVTDYHSILHSSAKIPINKNWSKNEFPEDIEILFL